MSSWTKYIKSRIARNKNFLAIFTGPTGSSKSWSAMSVAEQLDPEFNETRIVFKAKDLLALVNSGKLKKGSVIIWDETQIDLNNRSWQSLTNKLLNYLITTFRHRCFILFFTSPYADFLDSATMKLFHANFEMKRINKEEQTATINPILLQYNQSMKKWYRKHLRSISNNGGRKIKAWKVPKPSDKLIEAYEKQKILFTSNLNKEIEDKLGSLDSDGKLKKGPTPFSEKPLTINQGKVLACLEKGISSPTKIAEITGIHKSHVCENMNNLYLKGYKIVETVDGYAIARPTSQTTNLNYKPSEKMAGINSIESKELNENK